MRSRLLLASATVAVVSLAACSDINAPASVRHGLTAELSASLSRSGAATVNVLERNKPLDADAVASATIGPNGGAIRLSDAGFTLIVPRGAVASPTNFTVAAVPGSLVAYEFEPHGMTFAVPLVAVQDLRGTSSHGNSVSPLTLFAGYFRNAGEIDNAGSRATIHEAADVDSHGNSNGDSQGGEGKKGKSVTFPIFHFSGYLVAVRS